MHTNDSLLKNLIENECPDSTARIFPALVYDKAIGSVVEDADSKKYIDLSAGFAALPLGHNHPKIKKTIIEYLDSNGVMHGLGDVYSSKAKSEFVKTLKSFYQMDLTN